MVEDTKTAVAYRNWRVRRWRVEILTGEAAGQSTTVTDGLLVIGSGASVDLRIPDPTVSRVHARAGIEPGSVRIVDAGSKNGMFLAGARVPAIDLSVRGGVVQLGDVEIGFFPVDDETPITPSPSRRCGQMVGESEAIRLLFAKIERIAGSTATVLIHGETGSGKELVAEALHDLGPRKDRAFVVFDGGATPENLIESELFGHAKGAFTGAVQGFVGAFGRADTGTLFLDEIGELPLAIQPKLLRVLESRRFRPLGREHEVEVDVRVIAASHRDLAAEVREGRFREDLYYRLAVVELEVPPLRERLDDIPLLVDEIVGKLGVAGLDAESLRRLSHYTWPGNVRELRNLIERAAALAGDGPLHVDDADLRPSARTTETLAMDLPYKQAKELIVAEFTRKYLEQLLRRHGGNATAAAREAQLDRNWIVQLATKHGVRVRD